MANLTNLISSPFYNSGALQAPNLTLNFPRISWICNLGPKEATNL